MEEGREVNIEDMEAEEVEGMDYIKWNGRNGIYETKWRRGGRSI